MRRRKLLIVATLVCCVLHAGPVTSQQEMPLSSASSSGVWWSTKDRDRLETGFYGSRIDEELGYERRDPGRIHSNDSGLDRSISFRSNRAIDGSRSTDVSLKSSQGTRSSSNLPKSGTKSSEEIREKGRRFKNATIGDGICQSIDIRNNVVYFSTLKDCRVIEGFLQIVLIENNNETDFQNISFPALREITGYLLLYRVNGIKSLSNLFPNLEVIRGDILLTDYAFMVYEMQNLQEIGLKKLTKISRGGVRIEKNPNLCYTTTLDWSIIVPAGENVIRDNRHDASCPGCSQCPDGHCWTAQHCQRTEKPKCHEQCLGECYGPTESDCYVCKHYRHEGKCVENCPQNLYAYLSRRCITRESCQSMNHVRRAFRIEDSQTWRPFNGSCLTQCPDGYEDDLDENNMTTCRVCQDRCRKISDGAIIRHISDAQRFRGTTIVKGPLEFQIQNGNPNIMNELTDAFGLIEEITEYVKITHSFPITSLSFFKRLKVIKGERLDINNASLVVLDNPNLSNLFPESQKIRIENGRLFFHYNPRLCLSEIKRFGKMVNITNYTNLEVQPESNGEKVACDIDDLNIMVKEMGADYVDLMWDSYNPPDGQRLLSYLLSYIETENENITYEANACGNNTWQIVDVVIPKLSSTVSKHIGNLKPYTKYAVYVKTFTARENTSFASPVGQSKIIFFRTKSTIPSTPTNVVSIPMSDTEILVKWEPPVYPNGPLGYYMISSTLRLDDEELLSTRDYCNDTLVNEPEEEVVSPEISVRTPVVAEPISCCSKDVPLTTITSKKFEIFCHENITLSYMSPGWKDYCVFNRYNEDHDFSEDLFSLSSAERTDLSSLGFLGDSTDGETILYNVTAENNSFILRKLRHYSLYTITVAACGVKVENDREMCSSVQYSNTRTKRRDSADDVRNVKVTVTNDTIVEINWDSVKDPNALTVSYTIEYTNLDIKDAKKITECIPYTSRKERLNGHYLKNLSPGRYSVRVRSTSLAGNGAFSELVYFSVGLAEDNPVILISVATLGCLFIISVIAYLVYGSHPKKKKLERLIASVNPDYIECNYIESNYVVDSWEMPRENVVILEEFGLGNFGMVYHGRLVETGQDVAIKTISRTSTRKKKNEFLNEASVMKNISTYHIVKLLGVVSIGNPPFVIMEFMHNGDLKTYLLRIRDTPMVPDASSMIRMAAEIADGMAYLEFKKFVHRDLAARNCMVSRDLVCKIGDFGMARDVYENDYYKVGTEEALPIRWMAPESLSDWVFTSESDVWSFGVVMYEIVTLAETPYLGLGNNEVQNHVLSKGVLSIPPTCHKIFQMIMQKCFKWQPSERPTFMEIVADLEPFLGQDFCEKSFYHSEQGKDIRKSGVKRVYRHAAPLRFLWESGTVKWVRESEDNVTLLDQTKATSSRGGIFRNGF